MKSKLKITSALIYSLISLTVVSCGSTKDGVSAVDYDGIYEDLSYYSPKEESKEAEQKVVESSPNPFLLGYDQVMEYDPTEFLFTDIESYSTPYDEDLVSADSLHIGYTAETPWAYNDNRVEVNVYNNEFLPPAYVNPYFGWGGMNFFIGGFGYPPPLYGWNTYPYWNHGWGRYPYYYRPFPGYGPGRYPNTYYGRRDNRTSYQGRYNNRTYANNSSRSRAARVNASSRTKGYKSYSKNGRTKSYSRDGRTTYSKTRNQSARGNSTSATRKSSNKSYQSRNRSSNRSYNNSSSRGYGNRSSSSSMRRSSGYSRGGGSSSRGSSTGRRSGGRGNQ